MKSNKKIYLAGDHAGFKLKNKLKPYLGKLGYKVEDLGPHEFKKGDDYPDYVIPLARKVARDKGSKGIVMAGTGQGELIAMNKVKGARAALYYGGNLNIIRLSRGHNDSNILSLGARFVNEKEAKRAIKVWLNTKFDGGRHLRRLKKMQRIEK
jgi:ribose 5-phosphate isomerase B